MESQKRQNSGVLSCLVFLPLKKKSFFPPYSNHNLLLTKTVVYSSFKFCICCFKAVFLVEPLLLETCFLKLFIFDGMVVGWLFLKYFLQSPSRCRWTILLRLWQNTHILLYEKSSKNIQSRCLPGESRNGRVTFFWRVTASRILLRILQVVLIFLGVWLKLLIPWTLTSVV